MMWKKDWFSLIWLFLSFAILLFVLVVCDLKHMSINKGNNKITELRTILQRESQNT